MKERLFYLVDANVAIPLRNPFKIQKKLVETVNFVPEMTNQPTDSVLMNTNGILSKGETWMPELDFLMENDSISRMKSPFSPSESFLRLMADDEDDEEWSDNDEDEFDEDEEEDDEDWDEDDEDWDEDEDWDDEDVDDEEDEDWEEEEDEA